MKTKEDEREIAVAVGKLMEKHDRFSQLLGLHLEDVGPGSARVSVLVTEDKLNGHAICHGGLTFTLADTAFAYACNSRNQKTVALSCTINFIRPVQAGTKLTAYAQEQSVAGKTGVYDITVRDDSDVVVAHFRGTSYRSRDPVLPETVCHAEQKERSE